MLPVPQRPCLPDRVVSSRGWSANPMFRLKSNGKGKAYGMKKYRNRERSKRGNGDHSPTEIGIADGPVCKSSYRRSDRSVGLAAVSGAGDKSTASACSQLSLRPARGDGWSGGVSRGGRLREYLQHFVILFEKRRSVMGDREPETVRFMERWVQRGSAPSNPGLRARPWVGGSMGEEVKEVRRETRYRWA